MFKKIKIDKYLILFPLLVTLFGLFFLNIAFKKLQLERLEIKHGLINNIGERLENLFNNSPMLSEKEKLEIIISTVEFHDCSYYRVYAAAYNNHNDLELITTRCAQDTPTVLDPMKSLEFRKQISFLKKGTLYINNDGMEFKIKFDWVTNEILVVSGVTNTSIMDFTPWVLWGMIIVFASIIISQMLVVFYVVNLRRKHNMCLVCDDGKT